MGKKRYLHPVSTLASSNHQNTSSSPVSADAPLAAIGQAAYAASPDTATASKLLGRAKQAPNRRLLAESRAELSLNLPSLLTCGVRVKTSFLLHLWLSVKHDLPVVQPSWHGCTLQLHRDTGRVANSSPFSLSPKTITNSQPRIHRYDVQCQSGKTSIASRTHARGKSKSTSNVLYNKQRMKK